MVGLGTMRGNRDIPSMREEGVTRVSQQGVEQAKTPLE